MSSRHDKRKRPSSSRARPGKGPERGKDRRSQATAKTRSPVRSAGRREEAEALAKAMRHGANDKVIADSLTHGFHTYPARMHPATARDLIALCAQGEGQKVYDPFCGSGTTLVEARAAGHIAIGSDLNPLALLLAASKTWAPTKERLESFEVVAEEIATITFAEGKAARRADYQPRPLRTPRGIDRNVRDEEIAEWYAPHVRRELECIASEIDVVRDQDEEMADRLATCLSSILVKTSKRASDTSSKVVRRNIARGAPARWFEERAKLLVAGLRDLYRVSGNSEASISPLDARECASLRPAGSIDAIISSPPYVGTYDYVDHHRLRLAFLGLPYDSFERSELGARRHFKGRGPAAFADARRAFEQSLKGCHALLRSGGRMALMVGDSVAGVEPVFADDLVRELCEPGFRLIAWANQARPKLGSLERRAFQESDKREHLLLFEKVGD